MDGAIAVVRAMEAAVSTGDLSSGVATSGQGRVIGATSPTVAVTDTAKVQTTAITLPPSPPPSPPPPTSAASASGGGGGGVGTSAASNEGAVAKTVDGVTAGNSAMLITFSMLTVGVLLFFCLAYYCVEYRMGDEKKPEHLRKAGYDRSVAPPGGVRSGLPGGPPVKGARIIPVFAYPPVAPNPPYSRLLLISSRMMTPELLVAAAKRPEVGVILFDWNTFSLEDLIAACKQATGGGLLSNKLDSIALMTHGKPGNVNVVKGRRTNLKNLDKFKDLNEFWVDIAGLVKSPLIDRETGETLSPGGRVDLLACSVAATAEGVDLVARLEKITGVNFAASDDVTEVGDFNLETDGVDATAYFVPEKLEKWKGRAFLEDEHGKRRTPTGKKYVNGALIDILRGGGAEGSGVEVESGAPPLPDEMPDIWVEDEDAPPLPDDLPLDEDDDWLPYVSPEEQAARANGDGGEGGSAEAAKKRHPSAATAGQGSTPNARNIFSLLREHLKKRRKQARDLYRRRCSPTDGKMNIEALKSLVETLLPDVTPREMRHFVVMVDVNGDGRLTAKEFETALKTGRSMQSAVGARRGGGDAGVSGGASGGGGDGGGDVVGSAVVWENVMLRLREYLTSEATTAEKLFEEADTDESGYLEVTELARLVKKMLPRINDDEIKFLVTNLVFLDANGDGRVSLKELKQVVHES